jgi:hypothetical protein
MDTSHGAAVQISVFIVSNVRLHREGLVALLRGCPSIKVLGADVPVSGYSIEPHDALTPAVGAFTRKAPRSSVQRIQANDIDLAEVQRRIWIYRSQWSAAGRT